MHVEVDQSGKVNDTRTDTVLAFANGESYAVLIPARVKRAYVAELRRRRKSRLRPYLRFFVVGLYLLLRDHIGKMQQIVIDTEYVGQDEVIRQHLINLFRRDGIEDAADKIGFGYIGKDSSAHVRAYRVWKGDLAPDREITLADLLGK